MLTLFDAALGGLASAPVDLQPRRFGEQVIGNEARIVVALAERRKLDAEHRQPRGERLAERARGHPLLEPSLR